MSFRSKKAINQMGAWNQFVALSIEHLPPSQLSGE